MHNEVALLDVSMGTAELFSLVFKFLSPSLCAYIGAAFCLVCVLFVIFAAFNWVSSALNEWTLDLNTYFESFKELYGRQTLLSTNMSTNNPDNFEPRKLLKDRDAVPRTTVEQASLPYLKPAAVENILPTDAHYNDSKSLPGSLLNLKDGGYFWGDTFLYFLSAVVPFGRRSEWYNWIENGMHVHASHSARDVDWVLNADKHLATKYRTQIYNCVGSSEYSEPSETPASFGLGSNGDCSQSYNLEHGNVVFLNAVRRSSKTTAVKTSRACTILEFAPRQEKSTKP